MKRILLIGALCACLAAAPLALAAEWQPLPTDAQVVPFSELSNKMSSGDAVALTLDSNHPLSIVNKEDGAVYGCVSTLYQTWFEVADDALWQKIGVQRVQGVIDWNDLKFIAQAVLAYNQSAEEKIMLFSVQPQRFPNAFGAYDAIKADWEDMASVTSTQACAALLTERVMTLDEIGSGTYVAGIRIDETTYPLAKMEARCLTAGEQPSESTLAQIEAFAANVSPVQTGCFFEDMAYDTLKAEWLYDAPLPSEENFDLWKQLQ